MFSIYWPISKGMLEIGDVIQYRGAKVRILELSLAMYFEVNGHLSYKVKVRKEI